jgi:hypothetical protein
MALAVAVSQREKRGEIFLRQLEQHQVSIF